MKLRVIGIGGCGCNTVGGLSIKGMTDVDMVVVDNGSELTKRTYPVKKLTVELDDPARDDKMWELVAGCPAVLVVAGMGGKYSVEVIEALCRVHGQMHLNVGFVWVFVVMPFNFEGRDKRAADNLAKVKNAASKVITFDNNDLRQYNDRPLNEAFSVVDQEVCEVIDVAKASITG
ncbi:MAG: hypothetical protein IKS36_05085 [Bacteroidales bacterium]|nr:hypothetical protein [Bacteroidales bacterium]